MKPAKRIIPCLDIKDGRTVKGTNFVDLKDAGDPIELAQAYAQQGADELVFLDISATVEKRKTLVPLVERIAAVLNIPFTVGGGVRTVEDAAALLRAGADKISVNSALFRDRSLAPKIADRFGSQCLVAAIDAKWNGRFQEVYLSGGREATGADLFEWAKEIVGLGAGEVLYTSMDHDGTRQGFALSQLRQLNGMLPVPVIASGGAGTIEHFAAVLEEGVADAALAAGVFHFGKIALPDLKQALKSKGICVRI